MAHEHKDHTIARLYRIEAHLFLKGYARHEMSKERYDLNLNAGAIMLNGKRSALQLNTKVAPLLYMQ
jgi:hypothetical protein